jgi:hypothetical protein
MRDDIARICDARAGVVKEIMNKERKETVPNRKIAKKQSDRIALCAS